MLAHHGMKFYFAILYVKIFNWGTNQWIANKIPIESFFFVTRTWIINLEVLFLAEVLGKNPRVGALKKLLFCCFWTLFGITSSFFSHPESSFQICLQTFARKIALLQTCSHLENLRKIKHYCNEAIFLLVRMQKMKKPFNDKSPRLRTSHVYSVIMNANWHVFVSEKKHWLKGTSFSWYQMKKWPSFSPDTSS